MAKKMSRQDMPELDTLDEDIFSDIFDEFETADLDDAVSEEDFLNEDFLDEDFLRSFDSEEEQPENKPAEADISGNEEELLSLFGDVDNILSGAKEQMNTVNTSVQKQPEISPENAAANSALEAFLGTGGIEVEEPLPDGDFSVGNLFSDGSDDGQSAEPQDDVDVLKILEGLDGIDLELEEEGFGANGNDAAANSAFEAFMGQQTQATEPAEEVPGKKKGKKEKKEKKKADEKGGFLSKLGLILFGEDDEDEEGETSKKTIIGSDDADGIETIDIDMDSVDNLALFGEKPASAAPEKEEKGKKGKKEKKKKEKKEKVKKEKPKKEKKPRPKKEKKPKPPKEPDNTPPLPKKPVILIFLMAASLVTLILMGTNLLGYANQMNSAGKQYAKQNYSKAFAEISGMKIKEEDMALYEKYHVMAMVSSELEAYKTLMNAEFYDMALDCLIRTIGRAEKYRPEAEAYGCIQELNTLEAEAEAILGQMFGVTKERALELYASKTKEDYSYAIKRILKDLGMEKVSE